MRGLLIKQHRLSEPGLIEPLAAERGAELHPHVPSEEGPLPPLDGFDFIVATAPDQDTVTVLAPARSLAGVAALQWGVLRVAPSGAEEGRLR